LAARLGNIAGKPIELVGREAKTYTHTSFLSQQKPVLEEWARRIRNAADRVVEDEKTNVRQLFGQSAETA
jgi:hypothetical protein